MKSKVIKDFNKYLKRLNKGYQDDYSAILHDIAFILSFDYLDNPYKIYEFLINN